MDPNGASDGEANSHTPLSCTLDRDSAAAFETLVALGATLDPDPCNDADDEHLFKVACSRGCEQVVALMLRRGWLDIRSGDVLSGLYHAVVMMENH